jgi:PQQ-dependent dehydrogenase (methanol/ethanol family)
MVLNLLLRSISPQKGELMKMNSGKSRFSHEAKSVLYVLLFVLFLPLPLFSQDPQPARSTLLQDGRTVYASNCSGCHGADTNGTDHAPKLTGNPDVRGRSVEQLRNLIVSGIAAGGMPAFTLPAHQLDAVAAYVHSLNSPISQTTVAGDGTVGEQFFRGEGDCGSCHMVQGSGASKGPDLSNVGSRLTAQEITGVLLHPDQHITTGYGLVTVTLLSGQTIRGFARGRTNFSVQLQDLDGTFHLLKPHDIVSIVDDANSLMKPVRATSEQIQNLTAYLSQLKGFEPGPLKEPNALYAAQAQDIGFSRILDPQAGDWPTYNGQLNGNRYSNLTQINEANVKNLALKWIFPMPHFGLESTPVVVDGVMYLSGNNQAYAIDALTGTQIWKYSRPPSTNLVGDASVGTNRGVAVLGDKIFVVTDNAHLLALNRVTGSLIWEVVMPEQPEHYGSTVSPLIVNDTVIAGVSGGDWGMRGFIICYKASTGEMLWRHWTLPAKEGDPGIKTWGKEPPLLGGGSTWLTGSYDKETDTLYWTTGNPWPDQDDSGRPGDNLFTNCILALNPKTGELKWYFQFTPHDTADRDANEPTVLIDTEYQGKPRKLVLHADRNGFFYVLDRTNGKLLLTKQFVHRANWATGIGADGRPQLAVQPATASHKDRTCPNNAANWSSTAFSPITRLYYVMTLEACNEISQSGGQQAVVPGKRYMRAIDIDTGKVAWEVPQTGQVMLKTWPGVLATAGGLVFHGDPNGAFVAVDQRKGKTLWHFDTNVGMKASPMTYAVGGKQFVVVAAGSVFLCFGLP